MLADSILIHNAIHSEGNFQIGLKLLSFTFEDFECEVHLSNILELCYSASSNIEQDSV